MRTYQEYGTKRISEKKGFKGYVPAIRPDSFFPAQKPYRVGLVFTHKNRDFGAISVTE